jgi:hypothetical protein
VHAITLVATFIATFVDSHASRQRRPTKDATKALAWVATLWLGAMAQARAATLTNPNSFPEVYLRATNEFAQANFFKPAEPPITDLSFTLAPLILQQVSGDLGPTHPPERFGLLTRSNGVLTVDTSRPTLYVVADTIQIRQKPYAQLAYLWVYAGESGGPGLPSLGVQGVRVTLNTSGQPAIWEMLADHSGAEVFFVTQKLEEAAKAEYGEPLPGRHCSIEPSWAEAPQAVVARVLEDGPVAMGPMVYLKAGTHDVSTVLCRCMPAQVKKLLQTSTYSMAHLAVGRPHELLDEARWRAQVPPAFWPGNANGHGRLEKCLRLPRSF